MVSKGGVPKGRIIPVYLTDEGDVYPIYLHEILWMYRLNRKPILKI